jgi:mannose-1-phosphate guanylyltransferase/mannose-6-phosphate isomerase
MRIVILSGGNGTRLWPASRRHKPKQFLRLFGGESLLVQTARRALACGARHLAVVTNAEQRALTEAELDEAGIAAEIVLEPVQRNTAPAMALAAARTAAGEPESVVAFLPADHYVADDAAFAAALSAAVKAAEAQPYLVVLGRQPDRPETGYGYIERGLEAAPGVYAVTRFVEKPDAATAARYLAGGRHWWNTGIVAGRARVFCEEIERHAAPIAAAVSAAVGAPARYADAPNVSFDYAVLEKSDRVRAVPALFGWSDVGGWPGWAANAPADPRGNAANPAARLITLDAFGNAVWSEKTVVLDHVEGLLVVDTPDVLYVAPRPLAGATAAVRRHVTEIAPALE